MTTLSRTSGTLLQRHCACGSGKSAASDDCDDCSRRKLSRSASGQAASPVVTPPVVGEVLNEPGHPLDDSTRAYMEPRLGHDFSKVRIHADERASESARSVGALAYTVGNDVVFNAGQFAPQTRSGLHLLAHELAHVVQQQGGGGAEPVASASPEQEHEASVVADAVTSSGRLVAPALRSGPVLAKESDGESPPPPSTSAEPMNTATAEREREVEAVESGGKSYVLYQLEVRFDGSSSWLANNPGNMDSTANTDSWGAYEGKKLKWGQHGFAIFPSEDVGLAAVRSFLRKFQSERDISLMMNLFAPAGDKNDPEGYANKVARALGVPVSTQVKTLSDDQIATFALEIKKAEGWIVGTTKPRGDPVLPEDIRKRT
ncbi:MAG: hypothetical protein QOH49_3417 [Acidobacteriota bacterium]|nr:hypothetical protein [Acidobacteriota bacterium]